MLYQITVDVKSVAGNVLYEVEAKSKQEALDLYNDGKATYVSEELEITELEDPRLSDVME